MLCVPKQPPTTNLTAGPVLDIALNQLVVLEKELGDMIRVISSES